MRYDKEIYFMQEATRTRLPNGQYETVASDPILAYAHVSSTGDETKQLLYGNIKNDSIVVRFQNKPDGLSEEFEFNDTTYIADQIKPFRRDFVIYGSEKP